MGHNVHHFEYYQAAATTGREQMNDFFLSIVKNSGYDLVLVVPHKNQFIPEVIDEAGKYALTLCWNCDDDWRWEDYSKEYVNYYTYMVTTYRHIYEANKKKFPNLILSQWGCTGFNQGFSTLKDINISFVGYCYKTRIQQIESLRRKLNLVAYGKGVKPHKSLERKLKEWCAGKLLGVSLEDKDLELPDQAAVKAIWNRSKISFTPLDASRSKNLQIKARIFDMGLSGTVMLCTHNPDLYEYYEPGKEFMEFVTLDECIEKARFLLSHERERALIAKRYYERTWAEHLWQHRFSALFKTIGLLKTTL